MEQGATRGFEGSPPAGWYPDPLGVAEQRWWDGSSWTVNVHGTPLGARSSSSVPGDSVDSDDETPDVARRWLILGSIGALLVGSLLPWVVLTAPTGARIALMGLDGDGILTLGLALVAAMFAAPLFRNRELGTRRSIGVVAVAVLAFAASFAAAVRLLGGTAGAEFTQPRVGLGLLICVASSIVLIWASLPTSNNRVEPE